MLQSEYVTFEIEIKNLLFYKKEFLLHDLDYFVALLKFEMFDFVYKQIFNRDFKMRIIKAIEKYINKTDISIEQILDYLKDTNFFIINIKENKEDYIKFDLSISNLYFELQKYLSGSVPFFLGKFFGLTKTPERFKEIFEKEIKKTYSHDFSIKIK
jgi:hypothetical protein